MAGLPRFERPFKIADGIEQTARAHVLALIAEVSGCTFADQSVGLFFGESRQLRARDLAGLVFGHARQYCTGIEARIPLLQFERVAFEHSIKFMAAGKEQATIWRLIEQLARGFGA